MKIRDQFLDVVFDNNPLIIAGVASNRALATGKVGEDTHRLADALTALGDPAELIRKLMASIRGDDDGEYVAGGNACFIVINGKSATVCFETATDDEEYQLPLSDILLATLDWQRAWDSASTL